MSGTKKGGSKAAATNKAKDPNFYANIGKKGGQVRGRGYFGWLKDNGMTDVIRESGRKGGTKSKRKPNAVQEA